MSAIEIRRHFCGTPISPWLRSLRAAQAAVAVPLNDHTVTSTQPMQIRHTLDVPEALAAVRTVLGPLLNNALAIGAMVDIRCLHLGDHAKDRSTFTTVFCLVNPRRCTLRTVGRKHRGTRPLLVHGIVTRLFRGAQSKLTHCRSLVALLVQHIMRGFVKIHGFVNASILSCN